MSCIQITSCHPLPSIFVSKSSLSPSVFSKPCFLPINSNSLVRTSLKLTTYVSKHSKCLPASKYRQCSPVCLFGGEGKSESGAEDSLWKSLEKDMGSFKNSLEDGLRERIEEQEYGDVDGGQGSGEEPPYGGGRGRGDGDNFNPFENEDEGDERLQVTLATVGLYVLYQIITGPEEDYIAIKQFIRYVFTGKRTKRLNRILRPWEKFWEDYIRKLTSRNKPKLSWLEMELLNTPTRYNSGFCREKGDDDDDYDDRYNVGDDDSDDDGTIEDQLRCVYKAGVDDTTLKNRLKHVLNVNSDGSSDNDDDDDDDDTTFKNRQKHVLNANSDGSSDDDDDDDNDDDDDQEEEEEEEL